MRKYVGTILRSTRVWVPRASDSARLGAVLESPSTSSYLDETGPT